MTPTELTQLICTMETKGGSFVGALAQALRYADPANRKRLLDAFPDVVQKYGPNGMFVIARQMAEDLVTQSK
jgi:2-oxo-4-hydroxy-4-carboxy--5-ureidoimidazoline (OHCU) decarboxylase